MGNLVSIITPTYNCEKYIKETIESVINQTYKNWEMLIIDDCSEDNTQTIVKSYAKNYPNIKYILLEGKKGAAIARNTGLKRAKGDFIAFLDSDDIWEPDKLEKQLTFMLENNIDFSYTNYIKIDENSNELNKLITGPKRVGKIQMTNYCWIGCLTVMYNARKVGLIQIENLEKRNDYAIWLRVIKKADCYLLDETLSRYRVRRGSISNQNVIKLIRHHYLLFKKGEKKSTLISIINTMRNLVFGTIKKIIYEKNIKNTNKEKSFEVLLVTNKGKNIIELLKNQNINSDIIISNQTDHCSYEEFKYQENKVKVYNINNKGVGLNRNNALMNSNANIVLLADDDIKYENNYKEIIINEFNKHPEADMIVFNLKNQDKSRPRYQIKKWKRVRKYNCLRYGAVRMAFRTDKIKEKNVFFSVLFGGGAKYSSGEDSLFLLECIRKGIKVYSSPKNIGTIYDEGSTWFNGYNEKFFYDKGVFHKIAFGKLANFMNIQFLIRHNKIVCDNFKMNQAYRIMKKGISYGKN